MHAVLFYLNSMCVCMKRMVLSKKHSPFTIDDSRP